MKENANTDLENILTIYQISIMTELEETLVKGWKQWTMVGKIMMKILIRTIKCN